MNEASSKLKTCIATVSIAGDFREKLAAISRAGFTGIEIFEQDFLAYDGRAVDVGWLVQDYGLEIMLFQPFRDFEGLPEPYRSRAFDRAERKFDLMNSMGADLVLICSNLSAHALGGIDRAADDLAELGERSKARGIRIGFEALAWGRHINEHRDAWEVVRRADHSHVGLILDSFHTLSRKIDPNTIRAIPGDKIFFVQLADAPLIDMDLFYWSRHFRNMPGEGDLPVVEFMRAVSSTGYAGPLSLEVFNDQFRGGSPTTIARDGHRSLLALMDDVRRSEPDMRLPAPELPARGSCLGIDFVEFTTSEAEASDLAARRFGVETLIRLLYPLAPHIAEEIWEFLGHDVMLANTDWPKADANMLTEDSVEIGVQVNGKLRDTVSLPVDAEEDVARAAALASAGVIRYLEGREPKKVIVVRNRIINVVV